jgi:hypothetical protein
MVGTVGKSTWSNFYQKFSKMYLVIFMSMDRHLLYKVADAVTLKHVFSAYNA